MVLVNTDFISGKTLATLGYVSGSRFVFSAIDSRDIDRAMEKMIANATQLGADGIINIRYAPSTNHAYISGTAVNFV